MPDDRDLLAEARAIDAALTPGPWYAVANDVAGGRAVQTVDKPTSEMETNPPAWVVDMVFRDSDADQIAAMRNLLPALLAELESQRAQIATLKFRLEPPDSPNFEVLLKELGIDMTNPQEVLAEKVVEQRERMRDMAEWAEWFAAERDYLRTEVAKDYAAIAEKQRRDNARVAAADIRAAELLARITELENQVGVLEGLMPDD